MTTFSPASMPRRGLDDIFVCYLDSNGDGILEDQTPRLIAFNGRWGGSGRGYLDRVPPATGQVLLSNSDGQLDIALFRQNSEVYIGARIDGETYPAVGGYLTNVDETRDPRTHQVRVVVTFSGVLSRLAQEDAYLPPRGIADRLTSEIVEDAISLKVPASRQRVTWAHNRVAASQYKPGTTDLNPSAAAALREMELVEGCFLNEGRGLDVVFPSRFEREIAELDDPIAGNYFALAHVADNVPRVAVKNYRVDWWYQSLFTRVVLTGSQSLVREAEGGSIHVASYRKDRLSDAPVIIPPGATVPLTLDLREVDDRVERTYAEVISWANLRTSGDSSIIQFELLDGTLLAGQTNVRVAVVRTTVTSVSITVTNGRAVPVRLRRWDMWGRPLRTLIIQTEPVVNASLEEEINFRRTLNLAAVHIGSGWNEDNPWDEIAGYMAFLLAKNGRPRQTARIEFLPLQTYPGEKRPTQRERYTFPHALRQAILRKPGDRITLQELPGAGLPEWEGLEAGQHYVEGGDLAMEAGAGRVVAGFNVSRRGRLPAIIHSYTGPLSQNSTSWVRVGDVIKLKEDRVSVIAIRAHRAGGGADLLSTWDADLAVMEVATNVHGAGRTLRNWLERDLDTDPQWLSTVVTLSGNVQVNARRRTASSPTIVIHEIRVWEMADLRFLPAGNILPEPPDTRCLATSDDYQTWAEVYNRSAIWVSGFPVGGLNYRDPTTVTNGLPVSPAYIIANTLGTVEDQGGWIAVPDILLEHLQAGVKADLPEIEGWTRTVNSESATRTTTTTYTRDTSAGGSRSGQRVRVVCLRVLAANGDLSEWGGRIDLDAWKFRRGFPGPFLYELSNNSIRFGKSYTNPYVNDNPERGKFWWDNAGQFRVRNDEGVSALVRCDNADPSHVGRGSGARPEPVTVPDAPTISLEAVGKGINVTITAPSDNGGAAITSYVTQYKLTSDSAWIQAADALGLSVMITGLANGSEYDVRTAARNSVGLSPYSAVSKATTPTYSGVLTVGSEASSGIHGWITHSGFIDPVRFDYNNSTYRILNLVWANDRKLRMVLDEGTLLPLTTELAMAIDGVAYTGFTASRATAASTRFTLDGTTDNPFPTDRKMHNITLTLA